MCTEVHEDTKKYSTVKLGTENLQVHLEWHKEE